MRSALATWPVSLITAALLVSSRASADAPAAPTAPTAPAAPPTETAPTAPTDAPAPETAGATATAPAPTTATAPTTAPEPTPAPAPKRPWTGTATLGVVSLPRVLDLEAMVVRRRDADPRFFHFAFGAGLEYLPKGLASFGPKTDFQWLQVGLDGRYFAWRWLFVGARLGWQSARTDSEKFGSAVEYNTTSFFFAPKAGILHTFANGLTIGGDLGATIPIGADTKLTSDGTEDSGARKASKTFGAFVMPFASLFRIGYTL
jgi:hypothetical protein